MLPNLHALPSAARRGPLATVRAAVEELDALAENLAAVGASARRVDAVRGLSTELAALGATLTHRRRASAAPPSSEHLAIAYQGGALLRRRAASPGARRLKRVDLSPEYADLLGRLLERFAAAQERLHA